MPRVPGMPFPGPVVCRLAPLEKKQGGSWAHQPRALERLRQSEAGAGKGRAGCRAGAEEAASPQLGCLYIFRVLLQRSSSIIPGSSGLPGQAGLRRRAVPLHESNALDCGLTAAVTAPGRTSLATHLAPSRTEEPAEIGQVPGFDQNNDGHDNNNNNVTDDNCQHFWHTYQVPGRHCYKLSMHTNLVRTYNNLGSGY